MKFYLAPMEGITGYVFRNAVHEQFGYGVDKYFTPFIEPHVNKGCMKHREKNDVIPEHNRGMHVVPQILTNSGEAFLLAESILKEYGYSELNINLGCPSATVTTKYRGSGLLRDKTRLDEMLAEIFEKTSCEISVKTRIGYDDPDEWAGILDIYNKYPLKELIIHPRVRNEFYDGAVHTDAFIYALDSCRCPLCYNGDIRSTEDYDRLMSELSGCGSAGQADAVMAGRGMVEDPSLLMRLKTHTENADGGCVSLSADADTQAHRDEKNIMLSLNDKTDITEAAAETMNSMHGRQERISADEIRKFTDRLMCGYRELLSGDTPVLHKMKEIWSWLIRSFPEHEKYLKRIVKAKKISEYQAAADEALEAYRHIYG